jgi:hypothetical protein
VHAERGTQRHGDKRGRAGRQDDDRREPGLALARAGRRVALVDLDARSASMHRFFDLAAQPGLTDVGLSASGSRMPSCASISVTRWFPRVESVTATASRRAASTFFLRGRSTESGRVRRASAARAYARLPSRANGHHPRRRAAASSCWRRDRRQLRGRRTHRRRTIERRPRTDARRSRPRPSSPAARLGVIVAGADFEKGYGYLTSPYQPSARGWPRRLEPRRSSASGLRLELRQPLRRSGTCIAAGSPSRPEIQRFALTFRKTLKGRLILREDLGDGVGSCIAFSGLRVAGPGPSLDAWLRRT